MYNTATFEELRALEHGEPVRHLCVAASADLLASCGRKKLLLWNPHTGALIWSTDVTELALGMWFEEDDMGMIVPTRNNKVISLSADSGTLLTSSVFFDLQENATTAPVYRQEATHASY